jgi:hypothetical protein
MAVLGKQLISAVEAMSDDLEWVDETEFVGDDDDRSKRAPLLNGL